jgi:hypothetical protein
MKWKPKERLEHILSIIKGDKSSSFTDIQKNLEKHGNPIKDRQLWIDIKTLREKGIDGRGIPIKLDKHKEYVVNSTYAKWSYEDLDEEIKNTIPLVMSLLNPYSHIPAVEYIINDLNKEHSVELNSLDQMIVMHNKTLSKKQEHANQQIITKVQKIIGWMRSNTVIEFLYTSVHISLKYQDDDWSFKRVMPIQIRVYEGRYYLLAIPYGKKVLSNNLRSYCVDKIKSKRIDPAYDNSKEEKRLTFDWKESFTKLNIEELYKDFIGIYGSLGTKDEPKLIERRFKDWAASHVEVCPLHHSQETRVNEDNDEELILSLKVHETEDLKYFFGRYREFCKEIDRI